VFNFAKTGLTLDTGSECLGLDSRHENVFISHAHADHAFSSKKSKRFMASDETLALLAARGFSLSGERWSNGFDLLRAGHVLGARQLAAECDGGVCVYAPDFKLSDSLTVKGAEVRECDELVVDGTFASPEYVFPEREITYQGIASWVKGNERNGHISVLGGYALGKAQELVACLNEYAGIQPCLSGETARLSRVYGEHGVKLGFVDVEAEPSALRGAFTAIVPLNKVNRLLAKRLESFYGKKVRVAAATGWALSRHYPVDAQFALSDHADSRELAEFIERTGAKRVYGERGARLK